MSQSDDTKHDARRDTRTATYHWWSRAIAILLAILLAILWWVGYGPNRANCCGATTPVVAAPAAAAVVAPPVVAQPVAPAPVAEVKPAAPAPDAACTSALKAAVGFNTGSAVLSAEGKKALDAMVDCIKVKGADVVGHTDNVGGDAPNLALSQRRADAVVAYLASKGVASASMSAKGEGEAKPIADNATIEGRAQNRRMEIVPR